MAEEVVNEDSADLSVYQWAVGKIVARIEPSQLPLGEDRNRMELAGFDALSDVGLRIVFTDESYLDIGFSGGEGSIAHKEQS